MIKFEDLGFNSFEEYIPSFFSTLMPSNKTYEYFADWDQISKDVKRYVNELQLLGSLKKIPPKEREEHLTKLLREYPQTAEVIPMLIAEITRDSKIDTFDPELEIFIDYNFVSEISPPKPPTK